MSMYEMKSSPYAVHFIDPKKEVVTMLLDTVKGRRKFWHESIKSVENRLNEVDKNLHLMDYTCHCINVVRKWMPDEDVKLFVCGVMNSTELR